MRRLCITVVYQSAGTLCANGNHVSSKALREDGILLYTSLNLIDGECKRIAFLNESTLEWPLLFQGISALFEHDEFPTCLNCINIKKC